MRVRARPYRRPDIRRSSATASIAAECARLQRDVAILPAAFPLEPRCRAQRNARTALSSLERFATFAEAARSATKLGRLERSPPAPSSVFRAIACRLAPARSGTHCQLRSAADERASSLGEREFALARDVASARSKPSRHSQRGSVTPAVAVVPRRSADAPDEQRPECVVCAVHGRRRPLRSSPAKRWAGA